MRGGEELDDEGKMKNTSSWSRHTKIIGHFFNEQNELPVGIGNNENKPLKEAIHIDQLFNCNTLARAQEIRLSSTDYSCPCLNMQVYFHLQVH